MGGAPGGEPGSRRALEATLAELLARRIPGCRGLASCERLSGGASQETHRLVIRTDRGEQRFALRRSPGGPPAPGRPGLAVEALLMQRAREAGVPEPEVRYVLREEDGLGEGFVMDWLEGETLGPRIVRDEALAGLRPRLARLCGEILARIHAIDLEASGLASRLVRASPEASVRETWKLYQGYGTPQPMIDFTARWLLEHLPRAHEMALVHGDFRNGNLMLSPEGVVAVLDWELAHVGDPMRDLGWICTNSWRYGRSDLPVGGFGAVEDLFAGYESVSAHRPDPAHVRFWEVFGSFWWSVGCLGMAEHHRTGPDRSVERAAIGRRSSECQVDCVNLLIPGPVERIAPAAGPSTLDMPRIDELVASVRDHLRGEVMGSSSGRARFLARVAANSLDVVRRELELGEAHRRRQEVRLRDLLGAERGLEALRWELVHGLRDGSIALDRPGLAELLRESVVSQVAIDQPEYSGLRTALAANAAADGRPR